MISFFNSPAGRGMLAVWFACLLIIFPREAFPWALASLALIYAFHNFFSAGKPGQSPTSGEVDAAGE